MKRYIRGILNRIGYTTAREQALEMELSQVKDQLGAATTRAEDFEKQLDLERNSFQAQLAGKEAEVATARAQLASKEAETAEAKSQLAGCTSERDLAAKHTARLDLRVQALKRRRERLQAELRKFQDQLARADVSGRIRELEEDKARLEQRLADLQTYFEEKQGSANPYQP